MKKYTTYLFDFDGTLFDTIKVCEYVFIEGFKQVGVNIDVDKVREYTRVPVPDTYRKYIPNATKEDIDDFLSLITEIVNTDEAHSYLEIFDDTYDTVLDLKTSEATLGIITSNNARHVNYTLKKYDLDFGVFDIVLGNELCKNSKPEPDSILLTLKMLNLNPDSTVVYIGDAINDCIAAERAGVDCILLDRYDEYKDCKYNKIKSLKELLM